MSARAWWLRGDGQSGLQVSGLGNSGFLIPVCQLESVLIAAAFLAVAFDQSFNVIRKRTASSRARFSATAVLRGSGQYGVSSALAPWCRRREARENEMLDSETVPSWNTPTESARRHQKNTRRSTDVSALDHILAGEQIIPPDKGLFLEETWRLHPDICAYTSELFYAGKLRSHAGLEKQKIKSAGPLRGSGLRYLAVAHSGNQNCSPEEAQAIATLVNTIMNSMSTWIDGDGQEKAITFEDIVIITRTTRRSLKFSSDCQAPVSVRWTNFRARKRPSQFIQWQRQAMRMRPAVWNSSTASTD